MKRQRTCWVAAALGIVAVAAGCAHDIHVRLPNREGPAGSITIVLTRPANDLTIAVNGVLVAERAHTKRVQIDGVATGVADVIIAAGGGAARVERHAEVLVEAGSNTAIPLAAPEPSMSSAVQMGVLSVVAYVLSRALYFAVF